MAARLLKEDTPVAVQVPDNIWRLVGEDLADSKDIYIPDSLLTYKPLQDFSLTCRRFRMLAIPLLFSTFVFNSPEELNAFLPFARKNPQLLAHVRDLVLVTVWDIKPATDRGAGRWQVSDVNEKMIDATYEDLTFLASRLRQTKLSSVLLDLTFMPARLQESSIYVPILGNVERLEFIHGPHYYDDDKLESVLSPVPDLRELSLSYDGPIVQSMSNYARAVGRMFGSAKPNVLPTRIDDLTLEAVHPPSLYQTLLCCQTQLQDLELRLGPSAPVLFVAAAAAGVCSNLQHLAIKLLPSGDPHEIRAPVDVVTSAIRKILKASAVLASLELRNVYAAAEVIGAFPMRTLHTVYLKGKKLPAEERETGEADRMFKALCRAVLGLPITSGTSLSKFEIYHAFQDLRGKSEDVEGKLRVKAGKGAIVAFSEYDEDDSDEDDEEEEEDY